MSAITSTTAVIPDGLRRCIAVCGHQPASIDFEGLEAGHE
jgi:hypothetical protein